MTSSPSFLCTSTSPLTLNFATSVRGMPRSFSIFSVMRSKVKTSVQNRPIWNATRSAKPLRKPRCFSMCWGLFLCETRKAGSMSLHLSHGRDLAGNANEADFLEIPFLHLFERQVVRAVGVPAPRARANLLVRRGDLGTRVARRVVLPDGGDHRPVDDARLERPREQRSDDAAVLGALHHVVALCSRHEDVLIRAENSLVGLAPRFHRRWRLSGESPSARASGTPTRKRRSPPPR